MAQKVTVKKLPKSLVEMTVAMSPEKVDNAVERAAREYSKKHPLPGFRPGKAPREAVQRKLGAEGLMQEALELAVKESYVEALVDNKIEALGSPKIEMGESKPGTDLEFKAVVAIFPKIKLCDVEKLEVKKIEPDKIKVDPKKVEETIKRLRLMRAKLVTVNREAKKGDRVEIDFKLFMGGAPYEGGSSINHPLVLGEGKFIPGFEDNVIGMKKDDKKRFELTFPKEYPEKKLAGKKGEFEVTMKLVQEQELPKLDDEFVQSAGGGKFKNIDEFKKAIGDNLKMEEQMRMINQGLDALIRLIIKNSPVEVPEIMVAEEKEKMYGELSVNASNMGLMVDDYLRQIKKTKEDLFKDWDDEAQKRIKASLALQEIANQKKIQASAEEIEAKKESLLKELKMDAAQMKKQKVDPERLETYVKSALANEKVIDWLKKDILGLK